MQSGIPVLVEQPPSRMWARSGAALLQTVLIVAGVNAIYVSFASQYDWRLGPVHLVAHGIFKPLLILSASFTLAILLRMTMGKSRNFVAANDPAMPPRSLSIAVAVFGTYAISFWINYHHPEWAHTDISASHASLRSLAEYFNRREYDGFYRPLGFLSLWADWRVFGEALAWYHLQSVVLHLLNSLLVSKLCRKLGYGDSASTAAALIFAVSPPSFEAVIWPGARFDEITTLFSLLALTLAIQYTVAGKFRTLAAGSCCLALGLASKESSYAVPPLLVVLWLRRRAEGAEPGEMKRWTHTIGSALVVALAAVLFRFLILGGVGGYGASLHFAINPKTFTSLMERAPLASQFAVDGTVHLPWWIQAALILFVVLLIYVVRTYRPDSRNGGWWLLALLLVALLPTANVITFLGPSLVQGRYLYFGSVWSAIFLGAVLVRTPLPRAALGLWVALASLAVFFNANVHKRRLDAIPGTVAHIASELRVNRQCREVALVDMPDQMNGALFSSDELLRTLRAALPGVEFDFARRNPRPSTCLIYSSSGQRVPNE